MLDRDTKTAQGVNKKAEMGLFDMEFTIYGCAYLKNDKMYYRLSTKAEDIYEYIETAALSEIYPGNIMHYSKRCPVLSGTKEAIAHDVKKDLAYQLQQHYPKAFFYDFYQLAETIGSDDAKDLLWQEAEALEGVFDEERLRYFEELVLYAYSCKKISTEQRNLLQDWIAEEKKDMLDDGISKDIFQKTLYGLAYEENGRIKYEENAVQERMFRKQYDLEQNGIFVTPIFSKTYWYNYTYRLPQVNSDFSADLRRIMNTEYLEKLKKIRATKSVMSADEFFVRAETIKEKYGMEAYQTTMRYGHRWGVL